MPLSVHETQVAEALYSLQRGAMLGRVVGHADECAQLFHLFLKADLPLARAMLVPRAFQVRPLHNSLPSVFHDKEESAMNIVQTRPFVVHSWQ
jgi:hypothetical protein